MKEKLKAKTWFGIVLFSLIGQIAWAMENMFYNLYIVDEFNAGTSSIALMVALSAVVATVTTLLIGALSDKLGKRKLFICGGYLLWSVIILLFCFINSRTISNASLGIALVILLDCVMTFFGSAANDACYNAYLTDISGSGNRGRIEGVNSAMPLIAILIVFGGLSSFAKIQSDGADTWYLVFIIIGGLVFLCGLIGLVTIRDPKPAPDRKAEPYFRNIVYGFRKDVIRQNKTLYIILGAFTLFGISLQIFMPYYIVYLQRAALSLSPADNLNLDTYILIMAPGIIIAAICTIFYGKVIDRFGFLKSLLPPLVLYLISLLILCLSTNGLILFHFTSGMLVFFGNMLMMYGYLCCMASFNAVIRKYTPEGKTGMFQGLRIFCSVLIPMLIGPWIGSALCGGGAPFGVAGDSFSVSPYIFLGSCIAGILCILPLIPLFRRPKLATAEFAQLDRDCPLREYPDMQFRRKSYLSLNGLWDYKVTDAFQACDSFDGKILVPFCIESLASGVKRRLRKKEYIVYHRRFDLPENFSKERTLLHFLGVDQTYTVILNGDTYPAITPLCLPSSVDITASLKQSNELFVIVKDPLDPAIPHGKQSKHPGGIFYTPVSGIYYPVYIESVGKEAIQSIKMTATLDSLTLHVEAPCQELEAEIYDGDTAIFSGKILKDHRFFFENPKLWSPEHPFLYDMVLKTKDDEIRTYFALRTVRMKDGFVQLNGSRVFLAGVLDQGYYPEGIFTPSSYRSYEKDILAMKRCGFNLLRKHIKIELPYFYYLCDLHGMLVLQDFVNAGTYSFLRDTVLPTSVGMLRRKDKNLHRDPAMRKNFQQHAASVQEKLYNHPCVIGYTIFNEGWGQFCSRKQYQEALQRDPGRVYDSASGWFLPAESDFVSRHLYFSSIRKLKKRTTRPVFLSEFGGFAFCPDRYPLSGRTFGYRFFHSEEALEKALIRLLEKKVLPYKNSLCGFVYTQLSDVEEERNGLLTYDRNVMKVHEDVLRATLQKFQ